MPFPRLDRRRISDQVAGSIQSAIARGRFSVGQRLPGEHELAQTFETSRGTVREALRILESMGLVEIRSGSGTYVVEPPFGGRALSERLQWLLDRRDMVMEMLQVRSALQGQAARLFAESATDEQIAAVVVVHEKLTAIAESGDVDALTDVDAEFHFLIAASCGNSMLADLAHYAEDVYRTSNRAIMDLRAATTESSMAAEHDLIVEAIRSRDPAVAEEAMRSHIERVRTAVAQLDEGEVVR